MGGSDEATIVAWPETAASTWPFVIVPGDHEPDLGRPLGHIDVAPRHTATTSPLRSDQSLTCTDAGAPTIAICLSMPSRIDDLLAPPRRRERRDDHISLVRLQVWDACRPCSLNDFECPSPVVGEKFRRLYLRSNRHWASVAHAVRWAGQIEP